MTEGTIQIRRSEKRSEFFLFDYYFVYEVVGVYSGMRYSIIMLFWKMTALFRHFLCKFSSENNCKVKKQ